MRKQAPQSIKNALGQIIVHALTSSENVDVGYEYVADNFTMGDVALGDWIVTVQRKAKP